MRVQHETTAGGYELDDPAAINRLLILLQECVDLHERKDSDYAGTQPYGNFMRSIRFGMRPDLAIMVRLSDKFNRVETLRAKEERGEDPKVAESIEDTLRDLLNYAGILAVVRNMLAYQGVLPYRTDPTLTFARFVMRRLDMAIPEGDIFPALEAEFEVLCKALRDEQEGMGRAPEILIPAVCSRIIDLTAHMILARRA